MFKVLSLRQRLHVSLFTGLHQLYTGKSAQINTNKKNKWHPLVTSVNVCFVLELFQPQDENVDEFWVDFNLGSKCVSFFIDNPNASVIVSLV